MGLMRGMPMHPAEAFGRANNRRDEPCVRAYGVLGNLANVVDVVWVARVRHVGMVCR